jgi:plasmid stability protein
MAILQVRDIDNNLYNSLKISAKMQNRSVSQEVITIIETYLNSSQKNNKNATLEFLSLEGVWEDRRSADDIIKDIRKNRQQLNRFGKNNGIFD